MKKRSVLLFFICAMAFTLNAQISLKKQMKRAKKRVERKTEREINKKIDNTIDEGFDKVNGKKKKKEQEEIILMEDPEAYELAEEGSKAEFGFTGTIEFLVETVENNGQHAISVGIKDKLIAINVGGSSKRAIIDLEEETVTVLNKKEKTGIKKPLNTKRTEDPATSMTIQTTNEVKIINELVCRKHQVMHKDQPKLDLWLSNDLVFNYSAFLQSLDEENRALFPVLPTTLAGVPVKQTLLDAKGNPTKHYILSEVFEDDVSAGMFSNRGYKIENRDF